MSRRTSRSRPVELFRAGWGAALLIVPRGVLAHVHLLRADTKTVVTLRILGARQLAQAALSGIRPSPEVLAMGVWADTVHSLTAAALALADRSRVRAASADAAVAGLWAMSGYRDLGVGHTPAPAHQRRRDQLARTVLSIVPGGSPLMRLVDGVRGPGL